MIDTVLRAGARAGQGLRGALYLHSSRTPLAEADLNERQMTLGFATSCEGMCGT